MPRTIIEPFRIKSVEALPQTTPEAREAFLQAAHYNPFKLRASQITLDLLTDSGTGAMSANQWAALMMGDETYAGSESYYQLEAAVQDLTGIRHVIPTHQGRSAEHLLFSIANTAGRTVLANSHFDTTRANVEFLRGTALDLVIDAAYDPANEHPFKGNIDLAKLEDHLTRLGNEVVMVVMTLTNNTVGGQPVSLENVRAAAELTHRHGRLLFLDVSRFAENAWFIKQREPGFADISPRDISREMFRLCDGFWMSAKKDGLVNIGGLLGLNDDAMAEQARSMMVLTEGFPTYGGLAGRDLAALAVGLDEVLDEAYLSYRAASIQYFHRQLKDYGIQLVCPPGGHAVYIDAKAFYPKIPAHELPGLTLCNELYREGGVRCVEIGTLMFGKPDPAGGPDIAHTMELVRLAFPRRTYTQSHVDFLAEIVCAVYDRRTQASGYRITRQSHILRAFSAELAPIQY